jgi:hypothetical protein
MISLSIGFFIGYLTATLVNVARDYEMPKTEQEDLMLNHAAGTPCIYKGKSTVLRGPWRSEHRLQGEGKEKSAVGSLRPANIDCEGGRQVGNNLLPFLARAPRNG